MVIRVFLFLLFTNFPVLLPHPAPCSQTAGQQPDQEQHQCPGESAGKMVVDPDAECDPNKRRKGYGPANKTEHPKTKPDASRFTALCRELASLLHTQLIGDDRCLRSPRIVVHSPQFDADGSEHSDRLSTDR